MRQCKANCDLRSCLRGWYTTPLGHLAEEAERAALARLLPGLFGYHLVQVGAPCPTSLLAESPIRHRVVVDEDANAPGATLCASAAALPMASDSVDAVVLHHALEFSIDPHQVLREVERVLIPEGTVIVVCFNPYSAWGLRGWMRRRRGDAPWCGRFLSAPRLRDWLALLGFDTLRSEALLFRPPLQRPRLLRRLAVLEQWGARWWSPLGGINVIMARKRVSRLTPIRPRWSQRPRLIRGGLIEPTRRSGTGG